MELVDIILMILRFKPNQIAVVHVFFNPDGEAISVKTKKAFHSGIFDLTGGLSIELRARGIIATESGK